MAWKRSGVRFPSAPRPYHPIQRIAHDQPAGRTALGRVPPGAEADRPRARGAPPGRGAGGGPHQRTGRRAGRTGARGRWAVGHAVVGGRPGDDPLLLRGRVRARLAGVAAQDRRAPRERRRRTRAARELPARTREQVPARPLQRGRRLRIPPVTRRRAGAHDRRRRFLGRRARTRAPARATGARPSAAGRRGGVVAVGRPRVRRRVDDQPAPTTTSW